METHKKELYRSKLDGKVLSGMQLLGTTESQGEALAFVGEHGSPGPDGSVRIAAGALSMDQAMAYPSGVLLKTGCYIFTNGELFNVQSTLPEWLEKMSDGEDKPLFVTSFSNAMEHLTRGGGIARTGWNGKGLMVTLTSLHGFDTMPIIISKDGKRAPWVPSITDMMANDWVFIENGEPVSPMAMARRIANTLTTTAETAWHKYASMQDFGQDRVDAFEVYERVRCARRIR